MWEGAQLFRRTPSSLLPQLPDKILQKPPWSLTKQGPSGLLSEGAMAHCWGRPGEGLVDLTPRLPGEGLLDLIPGLPGGWARDVSTMTSSLETLSKSLDFSGSEFPPW
jgi:hypothetical protein